jgi:hypothetical protein
MVGDKCVGSKEECVHRWNARVCPENTKGDSVVLSVWAIVGIAVGGSLACGAAFCACCCWFCFRRRHQHRHHDHGYVLV